MTSASILLTQAPICEACRQKLAAAGMGVMEMRAPAALPPDLEGDVLVLVRHGRDLWWDIGWREEGEARLDGPWRYAPGLGEAAPVAWCRLPEIDPEREPWRILLAPFGGAAANDGP